MIRLSVAVVLFVASAVAHAQCLTPIVQVWGCIDNGWQVQTTSAASPALQACLAPGHPPVGIGCGGPSTLPDNNNNVLSAQCQEALLHLNYDANNNPSDQPGVIVTTPSECVRQDPARLRWEQRATEEGLTLGLNAIQVAWDWRKSPEHLIALTNTADRLTGIIETASVNNCGLPVLLVGDSCGGPLVTNFLANKTLAWKSKYLPHSVVEGDDQGGEFDVAGLLASGNWGYIFFNDSAADRRGIGNWEGLIRFFPQLALYGPTTPIFYFSSTNTTLPLSGFVDWLNQNGLSDIATHWQANQYSNPFPNANISCIWATNDVTATEGIFLTPDASTFTSAYVTTTNGDGEQLDKDNSWCVDSWTSAAQQAGLLFDSKSYDIPVGRNIPDKHTSLPSDARIWNSKLKLYTNWG